MRGFTYYVFPVVCICLSSSVSAAVLAGPTVNPSNGHLYYLLANVPASPNPFDGDRAEALSLGGDLVTINDSAEDAWVFGTFGPIAVTASPSASNKSLLIGLTDRAVEGNFVWIDGDPAAYRNWAGGEPAANFGGEDYTGISLNLSFFTPGKWHDIFFPIGDTTYGVVEVVPEPSSAILLGLAATALIARRRGRCAA